MDDFKGDPLSATRIVSFKSSNALFDVVTLPALAGDVEKDVLGGGGRAGGPAATLLWPLLFSPECASSVKKGFSSCPLAACV